MQPDPLDTLVNPRGERVAMMKDERQRNEWATRANEGVNHLIRRAKSQKAKLQEPTSSPLGTRWERFKTLHGKCLKLRDKFDGSLSGNNAEELADASLEFDKTLAKMEKILNKSERPQESISAKVSEKTAPLTETLHTVRDKAVAWLHPEPGERRASPKSKETPDKPDSKLWRIFTAPPTEPKER